PYPQQWVTEQAQERARAFGIRGVTYSFALGVVKNIIPAVASTNAIIAAACANEAVKLATFGGRVMDNYMMSVRARGLSRRLARSL
ncbi:unnamed protein product, partial [Discosporangium mesarthrocarpum]